MTTQQLNPFSIDIPQKMYEKSTGHGDIAVYQTQSFGNLLTWNGAIVLSESDSFVTHEMLVHPVLFTHQRPVKVAVVGCGFGTLQEILKHDAIQEIHCVLPHNLFEEPVAQFFGNLSLPQTDARVHYHFIESKQWLQQFNAPDFDVIIQDNNETNFLTEDYHAYFRALQPNGLLVQVWEKSIFNFKSMKTILSAISAAGFQDWQTLNFPQPSHATGWRTAMLITKLPTFNHLREKDVYNRTFKTRYYNFDTHKAALAIPEFIREELELTN